MRAAVIGFGVALVASLSVGWTPPAHALSPDRLRAAVASVAEARITELEPQSGLVVGAIVQGRTEVLGYGAMGQSNPTQPDGRTLFQIASLTKPFTGAILAELIRSGAVAANDPLDRHLHLARHVPLYQGRPIRLVDLATHTAGLPNVPETPNFSWARLEDPRNPYKPLTPAEVDAWLSGYELPVQPGTRFRYSNVGMAVLGEALSKVAGTSYEDLLKRIITERFAMTDTTLRLTPEQQSRKAVGHARGKEVPDWEAPAMQPSFGLYSTTDDLLKWLRINMGDCPGGCSNDVVNTLALAQTVQVQGTALADSGALGHGAMALGWFVDWARDGTPIYWHSGATGGFNSYMAFSRAHRWAVVALTNNDPDRVVADKVATDLLKKFEER